MKFTVVIKKDDGSQETTAIQANTRFEVYAEARRRGGTVVEIHESSPLLQKLQSFNIVIGSGVKQSDVMHVVKNLAAMLKAGLPLSRALSISERQSRGYLKTILHDVSERVVHGSLFNEALEAHSKVFSPLLVAMVKAGEESGSLAEALSVVATQMEQSEELTRKIRGAMIYPSIVVGAIIIVAVLMLIYVVPTLTKSFKELNVEMPLATRVIVAVSDFLAAHSLIALGSLALFFGAIMLFARSKIGSALILRVALLLPVIGELVRETFAARASRTLSSLLSAGVPLLRSLSIAEEVVRAPLFAVVIAEARERVRKGESLSSAFADHSKIYPFLMSDFLTVGEETGNVSDMLKQVAVYYETDIGQRTKDLSTIIEPMLMLFVGAMVGTFAVAMIAPIYSLSSAI